MSIAGNSGSADGAASHTFPGASWSAIIGGNPGGDDMTGHDNRSAPPAPTKQAQGTLGTRLAIRTVIVLTAITVGLLTTIGCGGAAEDRAPGFSLVGADRELVSLDGLLKSNDSVVIVFYRGFF